MAKNNAAQKNLEQLLLSPICEEALEVLSNGAEVHIKVDEKSYCFRKQKGKATVSSLTNEAAEADFTVSLSSAALAELTRYAEEEAKNLAELSLRVLQGLLSKDEDHAIHLQLQAGVLQLWRHGYFSLVVVGGRPVADFLATHGLKSVTAIMDLLKKMRKS